MKIKKYGAIDIGSNAVRLLISTVTDPEKKGKAPRYKKTSLIRIPIRLGEDVFIKGNIGPRNERRIIDTIHAFSLIMKTYELDRHIAFATSAMRNADNGKEVLHKIKESSGIDIQIIDGKTEAKYISATQLYDYIEDDKNYLYVDVGGGSTEYTLFIGGVNTKSKSFPIGTVRLLHNLVKEDIWKAAEKWVKKETKGFKAISLIGSGGNINNIFKSSGQKNGSPLSKEYLKKYTSTLKAMSYEQRILDLNLKEDRADVIIPAAEIYMRSMLWARSRRIYVPKIGLVDGMVRTLYKEDLEAQ